MRDMFPIEKFTIDHFVAILIFITTKDREIYWAESERHGMSEPPTKW